MTQLLTYKELVNKAKSLIENNKSPEEFWSNSKFQIVKYDLKTRNSISHYNKEIILVYTQEVLSRKKANTLIQDENNLFMGVKNIKYWNPKNEGQRVIVIHAKNDNFELEVTTAKKIKDNIKKENDLKSVYNLLK